MELQEKMAYFEEQVMKEADLVIEDQLSQYKDTLQKDYDDYCQRLKESHTTRLDNEKNNTRKENNKIISQTQIKQQRELFVEEEKLKQSLFESFKEEMQHYMQTVEYVVQLNHMIQSIKHYAQDEAFIVYINQSDADKINALNICENGDIKVSDRDFIGGVRGHLIKRNILVDYSFATLFANEEENFILKEVAASEL